LHELELAQHAGPLDEEEMFERGRTLIPNRYGLQGAVLCVASASGPRQPILRPAQLEEPTLERDLHREVLLGQNAVFDTTEDVQVRIEGQAIVLEQPRAWLGVDSLGSVGLVQPATDPDGSGLPALIEEEVGDRLARSFRLTAWILDRIDPVRRLSHAFAAGRFRAPDTRSTNGPCRSRACLSL
jgi:hypothetical protein